MKSRNAVTVVLLLVLVLGASLAGSFSVMSIFIDHYQTIGQIFAVELPVGLPASPSGLQQNRPRIAYLDEEEKRSVPMSFGRSLEDDPMLHAPPEENMIIVQEEDHIQGIRDDDGCVPIADWQSKSFPNCNSFHEIDLNRAVDEAVAGASMELLGTGFSRSAWRWNAERDAPIALKTHHLNGDFSEDSYELNRREAAAMGRLTSSPFVINIYGYCGLSALNELADFQFNTLQRYNRFIRKGKKSAESYFMKLQLASRVAVGVAHIHEIDGRPSMVHYDLNPSNVAIVADGKPKINDFNCAEFLRYNPKTNQTCGFKSRLQDPPWRAPEDVTIGNNNLLDEKVDVYALGHLLFTILTSRILPGKLHARFRDTNEPALVAIRTAMEMCFEPDPTKRPSSRDIVAVLMDAVEKLKPSAVQEK
mmetsp:Transcript_32402/g.53580  ORF Transcript_32402/g.53580 Transcript_32402/m.53580 type:complete len:419 (+) Transcript_32402:156-1412(+)